MVETVKDLDVGMCIHFPKISVGDVSYDEKDFVILSKTVTPGANGYELHILTCTGGTINATHTPTMKFNPDWVVTNPDDPSDVTVNIKPSSVNKMGGDHEIMTYLYPDSPDVVGKFTCMIVSNE